MKSEVRSVERTRFHAAVSILHLTGLQAVNANYELLGGKVSHRKLPSLRDTLNSTASAGSGTTTISPSRGQRHTVNHWVMKQSVQVDEIRDLRGA